jgi:oligopeptide/dipeptide ABC transporter ATP-binding protein
VEQPVSVSMQVSDGSREPAPAARGSLLAVSDLRVRFHTAGREVLAVDGMSYTLQQRKTLAIIGESGSGKTVSSRAIIGLLPPTAEVTGSVRFEGQELLGLPERTLRRHRGADIAMVFQDPSRSLNPTMRIGKQVVEAVRTHVDVDRKQAQARAIELLQLVRLPAAERRYHDYPHQLSGGMRQRVMIAIALAAKPKLLIADEATTALDVTTQAQIMELLLDLQQQLGMALIMISHDLGLAASFADDVLVVYAGRVVEKASTRELFAHVRMPYTRALLDAIPRVEQPSHTVLPVISGQPPNLATVPVGCVFAPRCPRARPDCRAVSPPLEEHEPSHWFACWHPVRDGEAA